MKDLVQGYVRNINKNVSYFAVPAVVGVIVFLGIYLAFNRTEAEAQLISTTSYRSSASQLPWDSPVTVKDDRRGGELKDLGVWLRSYDFLKDFLVESCSGKKPASFCDDFKKDKDRAPLRLMSMVSSQVDDGRILRVKAGAVNGAQASDLANALAKQLVDQQRKLEEMENKRMEEALLAKRNELEERLRNGLKRMSKMVYNGNASALSYDSGKQLSFLTELQTKMSEIDLQIADNERVINLIRAESGGRSNQNSDYGAALRIRSLRSDNQILTARKKSLSAQMQRSLSSQYVKGSGGSMAASPLMEQVRADAENHSSVVKALAKAQITLTMNEQPVEFFQKASPALARDRWSLPLMLAMGLFLSQLFAVSIFWLLRVWRRGTLENVRTRRASVQPITLSRLNESNH